MKTVLMASAAALALGGTAHHANAANYYVRDNGVNSTSGSCSLSAPCYDPAFVINTIGAHGGDKIILLCPTSGYYNFANASQEPNTMYVAGGGSDGSHLTIAGQTGCPVNAIGGTQPLIVGGANPDYHGVIEIAQGARFITIKHLDVTTLDPNRLAAGAASATSGGHSADHIEYLSDNFFNIPSCAVKNSSGDHLHVGNGTAVAVSYGDDCSAWNVLMPSLSPAANEDSSWGASILDVDNNSFALGVGSFGLPPSSSKHTDGNFIIADSFSTSGTPVKPQPCPSIPLVKVSQAGALYVGGKGVHFYESTCGVVDHVTIAYAFEDPYRQYYGGGAAFDAVGGNDDNGNPTAGGVLFEHSFGINVHAGAMPCAEDSTQVEPSKSVDMWSEGGTPQSGVCANYAGQMNLNAQSVNIDQGLGYAYGTATVDTVAGSNVLTLHNFQSPEGTAPLQGMAVICDHDYCPYGGVLLESNLFGGQGTQTFHLVNALGRAQNALATASGIPVWFFANLGEANNASIKNALYCEQSNGACGTWGIQ